MLSSKRTGTAEHGNFLHMPGRSPFSLSSVNQNKWFSSPGQLSPFLQPFTSGTSTYGPGRVVFIPKSREWRKEFDPEIRKDILRKDSPTDCHRARHFMLARHIHEAECLYTQTLALCPGDANLFNEEAVSATLSGRLPVAVSRFEKAPELNPDLISAGANLKRAQNPSSSARWCTCQGGSDHLEGDRLMAELRSQNPPPGNRSCLHDPGSTALHSPGRNHG